jgi:putative ABC transport system permease protein
MAFYLLRRLASVWNTLVRKEALDRDLDEELRAAADLLADRYRDQGLNIEAARRAAHEALGGTAGPSAPCAFVRVREDVREGRAGAGVESLLLDLRYSWRALRKAPGFTAVVGITLALGIGANTAIFSVVYAILLQPLPYREADRLAFIWLDNADVGYPRAPMSGPDLGDLRAANTTFTALGAIWASGTVALAGDGDPEQLRAAFVTTNFFDVLGAGTALGRTFRPEDAAPGAAPTILLGWDLFQRRYGGDASVVGRQILVNDEPTTVIGVMPRTFRLLLPPDAAVPDRLQVWAPFWPDLERGPRGNLFLRVVGRMRPGVTVAAARADVDAIGGRITRELGAPRAFSTVALQADGVREVRAPLLVVFAGVAILLMIACVNVASLLVARAASRSRETAVRVALGASRGRLVRQALLEGLLLTLAGAAGGLLSGFVGLRALVALAPESLSRVGTFGIDPAVLGFTLAVSLFWGVMFSLAPVTDLFRSDARRLLYASREHALSTLVSRAGRSTAAPVRYRMRAALVIVQVALSVVLVVGAGLLARAFVEVQKVDPGFETGRHLTFRVALPASRYRNAPAVISASVELQRRLSALPGVSSVGAISHLPYDDLPNWGLTYALDPVSAARRAAKADARAMSAGAFETLGVQLVEGRFFTDDEHSKNPVVIVDDRLARHLWPGRRAVGQQFLLGQASADQRMTVVGVVKHLRLRSLVEDLTPQIFLPYRLWQRSPMAYVVRTDGDPSSLASEVRTAVAAFDPRLPIFDVRTMSVYVEAARSVRRFTMLLTAAFAAAALVLTCIGVYGVLAFAVASRRHEFGVRKALGAGAAQVIGQVLREGLGFAVLGCGIGLGGALLTARLIQTELYAVHSRDPLTYAAAVAVILAGAALACLVPARRAMTVSPMDALRSE